MDSTRNLRAPTSSQRSSQERNAFGALLEIQRFSSFVAFPRRPEELLAEAARAIGEGLGCPNVLVVDRVARSFACRYTAGSGWGGASSQRLGAVLDLLIGEGPGRAVPARGSGRHHCQVARLDRIDLERLNHQLGALGRVEALGAAWRLEMPLRGHGLIALLAWPQTAREPDDADVCAASILVTMLATALETALRKRAVARRLSQIRRAKAAWEGTVDALPDIVCVLDARGLVTRANRAIETWGLGSVTSTAFGTLHDLLHPGCTQADCGLKGRLDEVRTPGSTAGVQEVEHADPLLGRHLRVKIGRVHATGSPDRPVARGPLYVVVQDISREKRAQQRAIKITEHLRRDLEHNSVALSTTYNDLRNATSKLATLELELVETRRRHRLVLENASVGLLMVRCGKIVYANRRFEEILDLPRGGLVGATIEGAASADGAPLGWLRLADGFDRDHPQERVVHTTRPDGSALWVRCSAVGVSGRAVQRTQFVTLIDVTEQILAQRAARISGQKLQRLTHSLIASQEAERKRIAGDLHDGIGQGLTAVKLTLQNLVAEARPDPDGPAADVLGACIHKTQEMMDEVRRIAMALRPTIIDTGGVLLALDRLCRELAEVARGLEVHRAIGVTEGDIPDAIKIHVFRVAQEALNNVLKHAQASNVWMHLELRNGALWLAIRDDGVGFDPAEVDTRPAGLGLSGMKQRVRLHDGDLRIRSRSGAGTTLVAVWRDPPAS